MRCLIVTADHFGLHPRLTDAILEAHRRGVLTSTSLVVNGADAPRAARLARHSRGLGVGIQLALTDLRPVLPAHRLPSLVSSGGALPARLGDFLRGLHLGHIRREEVQLELEAQLQLMEELGLSITHLDSLHHLHLHPCLLPLTLELMERYHIPYLRVARTDPVPLPLPWSLKWQTSSRTSQDPLPQRTLRWMMAALLPRLNAGALDTAGRTSTDHLLSFGLTGRFSLLELLQALPLLPEGSTELMVRTDFSQRLSRSEPTHPPDLEELVLLQDPVLFSRLRALQIEPIHFGQLALRRGFQSSLEA